ncbi:MAG: hypothetical protein ACRDAX_00675 [Propionibacteriaceae bacterium]
MTDILYPCLRLSLAQIQEDKPILDSSIDLSKLRSCEAVFCYNTAGLLIRRLYGASRIGDSIQLQLGPLSQESDIRISSISKQYGELDLNKTGWALRSQEQMQEHLQIWDSWDQRYAYFPYIWGSEPHPAIIEWTEKQNHTKRILCLSDCEGRNSNYLATKGHQVSAIELSATALARSHRESNISRYCGDSLRWSDTLTSNDIFDVIISIHGRLPATEEKLLAHRLRKHILKDGQLIEVATNNIAQLHMLFQEWPDFSFTTKTTDDVTFYFGTIKESVM